MLIESVIRLVLTGLLATAALPAIRAHVQEQVQAVIMQSLGELERSQRETRLFAQDSRATWPSSAAGLPTVSWHRQPLPTVHVTPRMYAQLTGSTSRTP